MKSSCLWVYLCLYILICLVQCPAAFSFISNSSLNHHVCRHDESLLLLQLKLQLHPLHPDGYYKTKYWKGSRDCCDWDGVTCDYFTGHVIGLDLSCNDVYRRNFLFGQLKSNSSLFHLTHLRSLNLSSNDFRGSTLPSEFGRLNSLTHLDLSHANFGGEIPVEFYHLSNLLTLDLSRSLNSTQIRCDVKMLFGNMTGLRVLRLSDQNLSNSELPVNMSSFLTYLDLGETGLRGELPATIFDKPNLQFLNFGGNDLEGTLPKSINGSNVLSIKELHLSYNRFSGPVPESIGNITAITVMDLSRNEFSGSFPSTISNLRHLTRLYLSENHLEGQILNVVCGLPNLTKLDLSGNNFVGQIPSSLTNMSRITILDISSNAFTGSLPSTAAGHGLQELFWMDLSNNSIQGMIPSWLFTLPSLGTLDLSSNKFTGRIGKLNSNTLRHLDFSSNELNIELESFYNLSSIETLHISKNTVTEHGGDFVKVFSPYLYWLEMSSCGLEKFPTFLRNNMSALSDLDLSDNSIRGPIPYWFTSNRMPELKSLKLSANFLTYVGDLPWQGLQILDLHSNSLSGTFPSSICNLTWLFLINLSQNKLNGNIPECLSNSSTPLQIQILDLSRNDFHGNIPTTIGAMHQLANLGLNGNHFQGPLPRSLANCTNLEVIDLGNNMITDTFPSWLHTLPELKILIFKSNNFHDSIRSPFANDSFSNLHILDLSHNNFTGPLPDKLFSRLKAIKNQSRVSPNDGLYMERDVGFVDNKYEYSVTISVKGEDVELTKVLKIFTTIDLSSNNFIGSILDSLSSLTSLRLLNLSHNSINGSIPPALGDMTNLEQLDLSNNQLTGDIPQTLTSLTFLGALNLSHNSLIGPIPQGNQFPTFSNESYIGNSGLCGAPLTRSCGDDKESPPTGEFQEDEEGDGFMMGFTWKAVVIGYGCGILLGFILGNVMLSIKKPRWLERFVYVEAAIILRRHNKRSRRTVQGGR